MNVRRVVLSVLGVTLVAAGVVPSAASASVTASCTAGVTGRVAIGKPSLNIPVTISGECAQPGGFGTWVVDFPDTRSQSMSFVGSSSGVWTFVDSMPVGQYVWRPQNAQAPGGASLTQNTPVATAKLAAGAWISSKRVGDVVTLNGTSLLYSVTTNNYFKRSAGGVFQFRERGTTTWKNLKSVTTNSSGVASMSYRYSKTRDYRFALYSTAISWDLGSAVTTR